MIPERGTWAYQAWLEGQLEAAVDQIAALHEELRDLRHEAPRRERESARSAEVWIEQLLEDLARTGLAAQVAWSLYMSAYEELREIKADSGA